MFIEVRDDKRYILQIGDIVRGEFNYFYTVIPKLDENNNKAYLLRDVNSDTGIHGITKTLEELTDKVRQEKQTIYSKNEYKLVLERR